MADIGHFDRKVIEGLPIHGRIGLGFEDVGLAEVMAVLTWANIPLSSVEEISTLTG